MVATSGREPAVADGKGARPGWEDFVHTGPGTLAGRYLRRFWHPVCRSEDLQAGWTRPVRILSEDFTLYRGEGGRPHLTAFRCAHRGAQLTAGWVEGEDLRCFYHGWKYDSSGQCIEQPGEAEPFCERIKIASRPTEDYVGLVFVYLGEGEPPPLPRYPEIENAGGLLENWREEWPCNYFNRLENAGDHVHVAFVHKHLGSKIQKHLDVVETEYGYENEDAEEPSAGRRPGHGFHMPNMNYFHSPAKERSLETGARPAFMWRVPVDDENHLGFGAQRVQVFGENIDAYLERRREVEREQERVPMVEVARAVLAGKMKTDEIARTRWWDVNSVQDMVTLIGQGVVADREHEHLGRSDVSVTMLRSLYMREMRALAEGRALKQWTHPQK